jgi:hypothetical protein
MANDIAELRFQQLRWTFSGLCELGHDWPFTNISHGDVNREAITIRVVVVRTNVFSVYVKCVTVGTRYILSNIPIEDITRALAARDGNGRWPGPSSPDPPEMPRFLLWHSWAGDASFAHFMVRQAEISAIGKPLRTGPWNLRRLNGPLQKTNDACLTL